MSEKIKSFSGRYVRVRREFLDECGQVKQSRLRHYHDIDFSQKTLEVSAEFYGVYMDLLYGETIETALIQSIEPEHYISFYDLDKHPRPVFFNANLFEVVRQEYHWVADDRFNNQ